MARRGDTSAPRLNAQQRYQQRVQNNRIVGQLNQLRAQGFSTEEIREAGNDAWYELGGGGGQAIVRDGDTPQSLASAAGTSVPDLLNANPDVNQLRTGMVVNLPNAYQQSERNRTPAYSPFQDRFDSMNSGAPRPGGLPSNAALGGTTTNPGGLSSTTSGAGGGLQPRVGGNPFLPGGAGAQTWQQASGGGSPLSGAPLRNPYPMYANAQGQLNRAPTAPTTPTIAQPTIPNAFSPSVDRQNRLAKEDFLPREYLSLAQSPIYNLNPNQTAYLEKMGYIQKSTPSPSGGGGYGGGGSGRGRGGGGFGRGGLGPMRTPSGGGGRAQQGDRLPAFGSGAGFRGLVNWRI